MQIVYSAQQLSELFSYLCTSGYCAELFKHQVLLRLDVHVEHKVVDDVSFCVSSEEKVNTRQICEQEDFVHA